MAEEQNTEEKQVDVPKQFKKLVEEIEKLAVVELAELVGVLEKKFGVSATAPVVVAPSSDEGGDTSGGEEKDSFTVVLKEAGGQKIQVIKAVRDITGKGLKESKDVVDGVPVNVAEGVKKEEGEEMKKKLEEAGATVELQ